VAEMPLIFLLAPSTPEPFTQGVCVPVNLTINVTTFGGVNTQMIQAQIPFTGAERMGRIIPLVYLEDQIIFGEPLSRSFVRLKYMGAEAQL
jgi:hypothetical protein